MELNIYRDILSNLPLGIMILDVSSSPHFLISEVNFAAASHFGASEYSLVGRSFLEFVVAPNSSNISCMLSAMSTDKQSFSSYVVLKSLSDDLFSCFLQGRLLPLSSKIVILLSMRLDAFVSNAEQELGGFHGKISEHAALLDKSRDAILGMDLLGVIKYWNSGAERLYGWTKDEAVGASYAGLVFPRVAQGELERLRATILQDVEWSGEHSQLTKSGDSIIVESSCSLVRDNSGRPKSILIVNSDITQKKKLEDRVSQAKKMESLGMLAGGLAHDFNNILGIIVGHATLLGQRCSNCSQKSHVDRVVEAATKGASLVRQLLAFACRDEVSFLRVDLNELICDTVKLVEGGFPSCVSLSTNLYSGLPVIVADATQITQAILNLCINAKDAISNEGSVVVSTDIVKGLDLRKKFPNAAFEYYVQIVVSDTGVGIDPEYKDRIFEPFFTTKDVSKGSGLGLSVVFGAVENHSGFLDVQSEPGEGTSFFVYLPVDIHAKCERDLGISSSVCEVESKDRKTILVMEDEDSIRDLVESVLGDLGYFVLSVKNGEDGLITFKNNSTSIDLVIADIEMPKMSGWEVLSRIKENREVKTVIMTGYLAHEQRVLSEKLGVDGIIIKPYDVVDLLAKIREVLGDVVEV